MAAVSSAPANDTASSGTPHKCRACGHRAKRYVGRCFACGSINTLDPDLSELPVLPSAANPAGLSMPLVSGPGQTEWIKASTETEARNPDRVTTGDRGLDLMLCGGAAKGSLILLAGMEGTGKSSFALFCLATVTAMGLGTGVYGCVEESRAMVAYRAQMLGAPISAALSYATCTTLADAERAIGLCSYFVLDSGSELVEQRQLGAMLKTLHGKLEASGTVGIVLMQINNRGEMAGMRRLKHIADVLLFGEHVDKRGHVLSARKAIGRVRIVLDGKNRFYNGKGKKPPREIYYRRDDAHGGRLVFEGVTADTTPKRAKKKRTKAAAKKRGKR
jgi:DNA repair protein RadA/Sms